MLDGKPSNFTTDDAQRRNTIATLLSDWGLVSIVSFGGYNDTCGLGNIKIIAHRNKSEWTLLPKYAIGNVK